MSARMTDDQRRAVETLSGDLVVRAGAGSGKTTVLAHRYAHALMSQEQRPPDPDRILTITFTSKAAGEIAERVRRVVSKELSVAEGRRVSDGWISTIHSLCGRLVRRHVLEAGVHPYFGQADEIEARALKTHAYERAVGALYDVDGDVAALLDAFEVGPLRERVMACHENVRALGLDPECALVPVDGSDLEPLHADLVRAAEELAEAISLERQTSSVMRKGIELAEWLDEVRVCVPDGPVTCEQIIRLSEEYGISRLQNDAKRANDSLKEAKQRLVTASLAVRHANAFAAFERLLRAYAGAYADLKAERGLLDFDDLQERAVALLEGDETIARRYRGQFDFLMIDEFQDTNALQMRVLASLRDDNLCVVGDERQSIYGFRYADVEIFERIGRELEQSVELSANFRSHAHVLGFVNAAFRQPHLFGPGFMQLEARRSGPWRIPLSESEPRVECVFVDCSDTDIASARVKEAETIAERIAGLVSAGVAGSDIAVLLRAAGSADVYAAALERRGIATIVNAGARLFDAPEVDEVTALLRAIALPTDDLALLKVLSGRLVGLSDDALAVIRRAAVGPLWDGLSRVATESPGLALAAPDVEAIGHAHRTIEALASRHATMPLGELVRSACEALGYDLALLAAGPSGVRAWANVLAVVRYAEAFEAAESNDPAEFVEYLKRRGEAGSDRPAPVDAGDNAVRIMTVHAAKGLEFPVVFVADLAAAQAHDPGPTLVEPQIVDGRHVAAVGLKLPEEPFGKAASSLHLRLADERRTRDIEEEKRCLYVACTRAEELLVMSGACRLDKEPGEGGALIDWIRAAIGNAPEGPCTPGDVPVSVRRLAASSEVAAGGRVFPDIEDGPFVPQLETVSTVAAAFDSAPRTVSFSSLRRQEVCPLSFYVQDVLGMRPAREDSQGSAARFGSAVHELLHGILDGLSPEERSAAIARRYRLTQAESNRLTTAVEGFLGSPLVERVRRADRHATEVPLYVPLGATALVGSLDLIGWEGSRALIVDYKTGAGPADKSERRGAYLLQAQCYALAALAAGAQTAEVDFAFVEHPGVHETFTYDRDDIEPIEARLLGIVDSMGDSPSRLSRYDANACGGCPALGGLCGIGAPKEQR